MRGRGRRRYSLAGFGILHALVVAVEEFSIKELHGYHSKDEMEENVDNEDVEHILERIDDTIKHRLQLGDSFDGLQGSENPENSE